MESEHRLLKRDFDLVFATNKSVLMRHVIPGTVMAGKNFPPGTTTINTAAGEEVSITRDKFIQLESSAGSAYIVLFDQEASNGVVHAVDTVF